MSGIQIILLTGISFIGIYFILSLRKKILDIVLLAIMVVIALAFIVWPDLTNIIAHKLGVGRGADLVFYVSIIIFWFIVLKLYIRIRKLEKMFTEIIRKDALAETKETQRQKT
jgi:hypothetical protein